MVYGSKTAVQHIICIMTNPFLKTTTASSIDYTSAVLVAGFWQWELGMYELQIPTEMSASSKAFSTFRDSRVALWRSINLRCWVGHQSSRKMDVQCQKGISAFITRSEMVYTYGVRLQEFPTMQMLYSLALHLRNSLLPIGTNASVMLAK